MTRCPTCGREQATEDDLLHAVILALRKARSRRAGVLSISQIWRVIAKAGGDPDQAHALLNRLIATGEAVRVCAGEYGAPLPPPRKVRRERLTGRWMK